MMEWAEFLTNNQPKGNMELNPKKNSGNNHVGNRGTDRGRNIRPRYELA